MNDGYVIFEHIFKRIEDIFKWIKDIFKWIKDIFKWIKDIFNSFKDIFEYKKISLNIWIYVKTAFQIAVLTYI